MYVHTEKCITRYLFFCYASSQQLEYSELTLLDRDALHAEDPIGDYWVVREELRLYNPSYCSKPHVVALNKMDLEDAGELEEELRSDLTAMASQMQVLHCPTAFHHLNL